MKILALNSGSSSLKIHLYDLTEADMLSPLPPAPLWAAQAEWGNTAGEIAVLVTAHGKTWRSTAREKSREEIVVTLLQMLWQGEQAVIGGPADIEAIGHRVVHGGTLFQEGVRITPTVLEHLHQLVPFAPLHQPLALAEVKVITHLFDQVPQVAVFDTAYYRTLPLVAQVYPGPYSWFEQGIRRYGFHGISHQYCARRSAQFAGLDPTRGHKRIITCHLGSGCSLTATRDGQSMATTMGFTPLEGLMMGTRSGSIDPGILLYLQREHGTTAEDLEHLLNHESGLKGISGLSGDMRVILQASAQGHPRAQLALDLFISRLRACLGSMIMALEGADVLTFTGGVGEHAPLVRARACQGLGFLGIALDAHANTSATSDRDIALPDAPVRVLVVQTREEWEIARACWNIQVGASSAQE